MATVKTTGVKLTYDKNGTTFNKTLSGFDATIISDTAKAKTFATGYSRIVDGTLTDANFIETTPIAIDD